MHNIEQECHYLSQALAKLKQNTPEYDFLHQKLEAAQEELEAMRQDLQFQAGYPTSEQKTPRRSQRMSPYRDGIDSQGNAVWKERYNGDISPLYDSASYSPAITRGSGRAVRQYRDNPDEDTETTGRTIMSDATNEDFTNAAPTTGGWTKPRKSIMAWIALTIVMLIGAIIMMALSKGDGTNWDVNQGNDDYDQPVEEYTEPCASFSMHLIPDQFGNETSWKIIQYNGIEKSKLQEAQESQGSVVLAGGPYSYRKAFDREAIGGAGGGGHYEMVHSTTCLPVGSYTFVLYDAKGDGICCSYGRGEYGINLSKGKVIRPLSNGNFASKKEVTPFEVTADDINYLPATPSSTDTTPTNNNDSSDAASTSLDVNAPVTDGPCASFSMHLIPDQFGNETTWKIARYDGIQLSGIQEALNHRLGTYVLAGGPYLYKKEFDSQAFGSHYEMVQASTCLSVGVYTFILYDSKGDGICCDYGRGEYGIDLSKGRVIRPLSSGRFSGPGQVTPFEVTTADIDVIPAISSSSMITPADDTALSDGVSLSSLNVEPEDLEGACASFSMHLVPDQFGNETTWEVMQKLSEDDEIESDGEEEDDLFYEDDLFDPTYYPTSSPISKPSQMGQRFLRESANNVPRALESWSVVLSGGPYAYTNDFDSETTSSSHYNAIIAEQCLPVGSYKFVLKDVDGICCDYGRGEYGVNLSKGRVIRPLTPGKFKGGSQTTSFDVTLEDVDVFPALPSLAEEIISNDESPGASSPSVDSDSVSSSVPNAETENNADIVTSPSSSAVDTITENVVASPPVANSPASTSIYSLNSLVTVPSDGVIPSRGKSYGILFDVQTALSDTPLVITGMDLYLDTQKTSHYEIWSKAGSWQDVNDSNPNYFAGFRQVSHGTITGKGASDFTKIALRDFENVEIISGGRHAFWVTLSDNNMVFQSYEGEGISRHEMKDAVQATKDGLEVFYGAAVRAYPLELADPETDFWTNAGFLGRLWILG